MKLMNRVANSVKRFHNEEKGMEALQVVLIIAVAAVILAFFVRFWPEVRDWAEEVINNLIDFDESA